jgi:hypothetical protein
VPSGAVRSTVQLLIRLTAIIAAGVLILAGQRTRQNCLLPRSSRNRPVPDVLGVPPPDILLIMSGLVIFAGAIIAIATRGRLGLKRPESDADLNSEG